METKRQGDLVWIDGVRGFSPGEYASSPHGCQARILEVVGDPLTYADLISYSGFAFRVGCHIQMCPSAGHPCCGYECTAGSDRALPWNVRGYQAPQDVPEPERAAFEEQARAAVVASVDRGIPVHYIAEEDGLIIGYGDGGKRWWCLHPYHEGGSQAFWHDEGTGFAGGFWPWELAVWERPKSEAERASDEELTLSALRQVVEMWETEQRGDYYVGRAAYERWIDWLRRVEAGTEADPKSGMQGNAWCFDVLVHSRRIAGQWLEAKADILDAGLAAGVRTAAHHYAQIPQVCMQGLDCPWSLALPPGKHAEWTGEMRQEQIRRLEAAFEHDRAAVASVAAALKATV